MSSPAAVHDVASFWQWFSANESDLFAFEQDQDRVFARLTAEMNAVHQDLTFEFGPVIDGRREFVISADGLKSAFPTVGALADAAPPLPRWTIVRFRPRREPGDFQIGNTIVRGADVSVVPETVDGKIGVRVLIAGYRPTPHSVFEQIGFLLLDETLGEFDVERKIGYVEVGPRPTRLPAHAIPLEQLAALVDRPPRLPR